MTYQAPLNIISVHVIHSCYTSTPVHYVPLGTSASYHTGAFGVVPSALMCLFKQVAACRTRDLVTNMGVSLLQCDAGRAKQMNAGAKAATGEHHLLR